MKDYQMLENISKAMRSEMPVASALFYGAAVLVAGRKFCVAAGYKTCALAAETFGSTSAPEWNKASAESLALAKKDMMRDLTAVIGCIGLTAVALASTEALLEKEKTMMDDVKENPVRYGTLFTAFIMTCLCRRNLCCSSRKSRLY